MCRYIEHAGSTLDATIVPAMLRDAINNAQVISTEATGALIQPAKAKGRPVAGLQERALHRRGRRP